MEPRETTVLPSSSAHPVIVTTAGRSTDRFVIAAQVAASGFQVRDAASWAVSFGRSLFSATQRSSIANLGKIDRRLGEALGASAPDELAIIPVRIVGQVMCLFALAIRAGTNLDAAVSIATASGISFPRLIRNANR